MGELVPDMEITDKSSDLQKASMNIDLMRNSGKTRIRLMKNFTPADASIVFSPQASNEGRKLVACGEVTGLSYYGPYTDSSSLVIGGGAYWYTAFVHSANC